MSPREGGGGPGGSGSGASWTDTSAGGDFSAIFASMNYRSFGVDGDFTGNGGYGGDNTGPVGSKEPEKDADGAAALLDANTAVPGQPFGPPSRRAGEGDLGREIEPYTGGQAPMGSLFAFVGEDVDPYSGVALGSESLDPFTGAQVMDPFAAPAPPTRAERASSFAAIGRHSLLSSPNLLASNGPIDSSNSTVRADPTGTQEKCYEDANRWALVCVPTLVPSQPPAPPIEEVTVRGVRPIRDQKLSTPAPAPAWTTQTEWAYPTPDSRLIQPITHYDTDNRPLNFVLNKILLPWRNALAFYENIAIAAFVGVDDALEHSPFQQEYHAAQVMLPMSKVMSIGVAAEELLLGLRYAEGLLNQVSFKNIATSLTFMSMGVEGGGGSLPWLRSATMPGTRLQFVGETPVLSEAAWAQAQVSVGGSKTEFVFNRMSRSGKISQILVDALERPGPVIEVKYGDMGQMFNPERYEHIIQQSYNLIDISRTFASTFGFEGVQYRVTTELGAVRLLSTFTLEHPELLRSGFLVVRWYPF